MNLKAVTAVLILICLLNACDYSKYKYGFFEGNWVCINYLDTVQKYRSVYAARQQPMVELVFKRHVDTALWMYNGIERQLYGFKHITSNQVMFNDVYEKPLSVYINEEAFYLSYTNKQTQMVFVRPDERLVDTGNQAEWPTTTQQVIHSLVIAGIYKLSNQPIPVQFYLSGKISGWDLYNYYEVCTGGDCASFYEGDVLYLSNQKTGNYYTWEWNKRTVDIFELVPVHAKGEKPYYKKGNKLITLYKLK